jgi:predicted dehydrogenase
MKRQEKGSDRISRRRFLAAAGALAISPGLHHVDNRTKAPSDKLHIAGIGIGGMGYANLRNLENENIVALCDADLKYSARTLKKYPGAVVYQDYRKMLDKQKDIDAVLIATPDHTHAVIAMAALKAGKHVYCQKPLTHDIYESRRLARAASGSKVSTVMGIQGHSGGGIRSICEWIWDGAIGEIRKIDAWCSLSYYPWGHAYWSSGWHDRPDDSVEAHDSLDWDLWIGPAPYRPYHPAYHPAVWRCWWDFGCGMMGDRGVHTLDSVVKALKPGPPVSVQASVMGGNQETHPLAAIVTFTFPQANKRPPLVLTWYEGLEPPSPPELEAGRRLPDEGGVLFKGDKGTIMCGVYGESPRLIPEDAMRAYRRPGQSLKRITVTHEADWAEHCKAGTQPDACFTYAGPLTELALLGNVAKRFPGITLEWDGPSMRIINHEEANSWVKRPYRPGWSL